MKATIIQCIQIICLAIAVSYNADAQMRPAPPVAGGDLLSRETSRVIELGARGLSVGSSGQVDVTREVQSLMAQPILSSLVILASSEAGRGQLDLYINGHVVLSRQEQLPMKRKAIQVDLNLQIRQIQSVVIVTNGRVLIHSLTVNSSRATLPSLDESRGGGRPPVVTDLCDIQQAGVVNGQFKKHIITLKGQAMDGADSIDELTAKIQQLENAGLCRLAQGECSVSAAGVVSGEFKRILVKRNNIAFTGADDLNKLLEVSDKIQAGRLCSMAVHTCDLASAGVAGGQFFQHRLLVNGEAIVGANDLGSVLNQLGLLRQRNICQ